MTQSVSSVEVSKSFGRVSRQALQSPIPAGERMIPAIFLAGYIIAGAKRNRRLVG